MEKVLRNSFALFLFLSKKLLEWLGLEVGIKAPLGTTFPISPSIPFSWAIYLLMMASSAKSFAWVSLTK